MAEQLLGLSEQDVSGERAGLQTRIGRVTVLETLAVETNSVSVDNLGRTTMQMNVDFDD